METCVRVFSGFPVIRPCTGFLACRLAGAIAPAFFHIQGLTATSYALHPEEIQSPPAKFLMRKCIHHLPPPPLPGGGLVCPPCAPPPPPGPGGGRPPPAALFAGDSNSPPPRRRRGRAGGLHCRSCASPARVRLRGRRTPCVFDCLHSYQTHRLPGTVMAFEFFLYHSSVCVRDGIHKPRICAAVRRFGAALLAGFQISGLDKLRGRRRDDIIYDRARRRRRPAV